VATVRRPRKRAAVAEPEPQYSARRILLDTHTWLWWYTDDKRLGRAASALVKQTDEVWFSAASAWEIAIKRSIGKLVLRRELDIANELERDGFTSLAISIAHAEEVRRLPSLHRDPFDRMLVAQARYEGLTILTADEHLSRYGVPTIDARK
jgi:PIN domain nuclease of toxin-antitoxin system